MTACAPLVSVVTLTRGRPLLLRRALRSVTAQSLPAGAAIEHVVVVDDCPVTARLLDDDIRAGVHVHLAARAGGDADGLRRVSSLRNVGIGLARGRWLAFLDDDNEWEADHLALLLDLAGRTGSRAVHSYMVLLWPDGSPYLERRLPWCLDETRAVTRYEQRVRQGVLMPGSNVVRDRAGRLDVPGDAHSIDMGEWLIDRQLLAGICICEEYTDEELADGVGEDDKLLQELLRRGEAIACTERPTLRYHVGGFSNRLRRNATAMPPVPFAPAPHAT